jgi:hypothetical protein
MTIVKIAHNKMPFISNDHARLIHYGHYHCWVLLLP